MTLDQWIASVRGRGAVAVTWITGGENGTALRVAKFVTPTGQVIYERAPLSLQIADAATIATENVWRAAGQAVAVRDSIISATGLDKGIVGVASKLTGVPRWAVVGGGLVIGYAMLASAGVVPPINKLFRG